MYLLKMKIDEIDDLVLEETFKYIKSFKQDKIKRLANDNLKRESIAGEYLLINGLKEYFNVDYNNIEIIKNSNGKPFIKDKDIYFSISHADNFVVCVLSTKDIGIDVEKIKEVNLKTLELFATDKEKDYIINTLDKVEERFFRIYTLKEAYVKMQGTDLTRIKDNELNFKNNSFYANDKSIMVKSIKDNDYIIGIIEKK